MKWKPHIYKTKGLWLFVPRNTGPKEDRMQQNADAWSYCAKRWARAAKK